MAKYANYFIHSNHYNKMDIFDLATKLRPGNLAHVVLDDGEHQYQPIIALDCRPGQKRSLIINTIDDRKIVKAFPAEISKLTLENNGFLLDKSSKFVEYYVKLNRNTQMKVKKTKDGKWAINLYQTVMKPGNEIDVQEIYMGQFNLFFVIENFFETFTNRPLQWVKPRLTSPSES